MNVSQIGNIAVPNVSGWLPPQSATAPFCVDALTGTTVGLVDIGAGQKAVDGIPADGRIVPIESEPGPLASMIAQPPVLSEEVLDEGGAEHINFGAATQTIAGAAPWQVRSNFDPRGIPLKPEPNGLPDDSSNDETPIYIPEGIASEPTITAPQAQALIPSKTAVPERGTVTGKPILFKTTADAKAALPSVPNEAKALALQSVELPGALFSLAASNVSDLSSAPLTQAFEGIQKTVNGQLNLEQDTLWIADLAREIVAFGNDQGTLRFGLSPKGLGHLEVAIEARPDGVGINLTTSTESAARIFATEQSRLIDELRQSGVRLAHCDLVGGQTSNQRQNAQPDHQAQLTPGGSQHSPEGDVAKAAMNIPRAGRFA